MLREIELRAPWMQEDEALDLLDEINLLPMWQRKPKARTLGERLQVFYLRRMEELRKRKAKAAASGAAPDAKAAPGH
jgi:hypothetical protein